MTDRDRIKVLQRILGQEQQIAETKKGVNEEINCIRIGIKEAILNDDQTIDLKKELKKELKQEGYRKHLNSKLNELKAQEIDIIMGNNQYDPDQLDLFDLEAVQREYDNMPEKKQEENGVIGAREAMAIDEADGFLIGRDKRRKKK